MQSSKRPEFALGRLCFLRFKFEALDIFCSVAAGNVEVDGTFLTRFYICSLCGPDI